MRLIGAVATLAVVALKASAQSSLAACAEPPDSTARQAIVAVGTLKVCLLAMRADPADSTPRRWARRSHIVILETQQPGDFRRLALDRATAWTVNGKPIPFDSTVESWQRVVIDVLDAGWAAHRLREMEDELRTSEIPLPTNADSAKARFQMLEKQISQLRGKLKSLDAEANRAQREMERSRSATGSQSDAERAWLDAVNKSRRLQAEIDTLGRRKDLLQLQLERLDPSNARTAARQSMSDEISSRKAIVDAELERALGRLREILAR